MTMTTRTAGLPYRRLNRWAMLGVLGLAFGLRLRYLTNFDFHIDEFFSLAAAQFVAQSGLPLYPTGLFYDPGLPYSYLAGVLFWLFGLNEALGRWPAVVFSTLAVATLYWLGERVLRSPGVGLVAALLLALSEESVLWGGSVRGTALAQWLGVVAVACLWWGLTRPSRRARWLFILAYVLTLLSHFSMVVLLPAWLLAGGVLWWLGRVQFTKALAQDVLLLGFGFGAAMSSGVIFQPPPSVEFQQTGGGLVDKLGRLLGKFLQFPPDLASAGPEYFWYFAEWPHGPLISLAVIGVVISLIRLRRDDAPPRDVGAIFLATIFGSVMLILLLLINQHWQRTRYLVMQAQPIFLLLGVFGGAQVLRVLTEGWLKSAGVRWGLGALGAIFLAVPFVSPLQDLLNPGSYLGWNRYDLAFSAVADDWQDSDRVGTMHPPAAWMYLGQNDYYVVQDSPKLILEPDGSVGDRYTGAEWLASVDEFNAALGNSERLWLVVQEFWLFNSYDPRLQQEILWRMDKKWGEGGVWALVSRGGTWPLAADIAVEHEASFVNGTQLRGYTALPETPVRGVPMQLTLFWAGPTIPFQQKVFVQLRNENNETVAQADHFIYDGKVPSSRWGDLLEGGPVRDGATLMVPPDLPPGAYRLAVGFYNPADFARLGVVDDQTGENALILATWELE